MRTALIVTGLLAVLAMSVAADAQGIVGGAQQGSSQGAKEGSKVLGPVGGAVGGVRRRGDGRGGWRREGRARRASFEAEEEKGNSVKSQLQPQKRSRQRVGLPNLAETNSFFLLLCENFRKQFTHSKNRYSFIYGRLEEKINSSFGTYCEQGTNHVHCLLNRWGGAVRRRGCNPRL